MVSFVNKFSKNPSQLTIYPTDINLNKRKTEKIERKDKFT